MAKEETVVRTVGSFSAGPRSHVWQHALGTWETINNSHHHHKLVAEGVTVRAHHQVLALAFIAVQSVNVDMTTANYVHVSATHRNVHIAA